VVHLTSLTYLSLYLRQHTILRAWRLTGMFVLFCLLFAALYPTSTTAWSCSISKTFQSQIKCATIQYPAPCFWTNQADQMKRLTSCIQDGLPSINGAMSYVFLVTSYLFPEVCNAVRTYTETFQHVDSRFISRIFRSVD
jgi:hypothetical protein